MRNKEQKSIPKQYLSQAVIQRFDCTSGLWIRSIAYGKFDNGSRLLVLKNQKVVEIEISVNCILLTVDRFP